MPANHFKFALNRLSFTSKIQSKSDGISTCNKITKANFDKVHALDYTQGKGDAECNV